MPASATQTAARLLSNHGEFIQRMTAKRFRLSRILCDSSINAPLICLSVSLLTFLPFASFFFNLQENPSQSAKKN
jgi:hypothetical protein